jgi:hypothetical protein
MGAEEAVAELTGNRPRGSVNWSFRPFGSWVMFSVVASPRDANYPLTTGQAKALMRDLTRLQSSNHPIKPGRCGWTLTRAPGFTMFTITGHSSRSSVTIPERVIPAFVEQIREALRGAKQNKGQA